MDRIKSEKSKIDIIFKFNNKKIKAFQGNIIQYSSQKENTPKKEKKKNTTEELENNKSILSSITSQLRSESDSKKEKNNTIFNFSNEKIKDHQNEFTLENENITAPDIHNSSGIFNKQKLAENLIKNKISATTSEEPYKGIDLTSCEDKNSIYEKHKGEVNKFLWLMFHDLNLRGTQLLAHISLN